MAFVAGLAALLPTVLTIALLVFAWGLLDRYVARPINAGVKAVLTTKPARTYLTYPLGGLEEIAAPPGPEKPPRVKKAGEEIKYADAVEYEDWLEENYPGGVGLVLGIIIVFFAGFFFTSFLGRKLRKWLEREFYRLPVIKAIYPYAKQVTEFIFKEPQKEKYTQVVAVEYPRKGIYSIGFVTGGGFRTISAASGRAMINLFIPSSPMPVTGYTIFVAEDEVLPLPISVDEAIRFSISGGVLIPVREAREGTAVKFTTDKIAGVIGRAKSE